MWIRINPDVSGFRVNRHCGILPIFALCPGQPSNFVCIQPCCCCIQPCLYTKANKLWKEYFLGFPNLHLSQSNIKVYYYT